MKATSLIFGVIMMSLVVGSFGLMITDMGNNYDVQIDENNLELYNQLNTTESMAYDLKDSTDLTTDPSIVDIVGQFVGKAVSSLKFTFLSMGSAITMTETATQDLGFPKMYKTALVTIIIIFLVLGVIISVMVKKDL